MTISQGAATGSWDVKLYPVEDTLGNQSPDNQKIAIIRLFSTVVPAAVVFTDKDGTAEDTYVIPAVEGVEYLVGEKVVEAGTYPGSGAVTVTARAKPDYVLKAGSVMEWTAIIQGDSL